jgi:hypothetical protein
MLYKCIFRLDSHLNVNFHVLNKSHTQGSLEKYLKHKVEMAEQAELEA